MKFVLLLAFLFMWLANPITGGKLFPGFNNPEKWMKRVIRKLQRKTSAYGSMIASNTAEISYNAGFISSMKCDGSGYINDPDNGLSCCYEDNLNEGQCLCNGMKIDDTSNPGSCCMANPDHPDHCLCSGTDMDDPTNLGNCCFANSGECLCNGNYTDVPSKRCFNLDWKGDGICDDQNNHRGCNFDGGDCCVQDVDTDLCTQCQCLEGEAPLPNAVGCCYEDQNNPGECLCTGTHLDDPDTPGICCMDDVDNPGNCFQCNDLTYCNGNGTCIGNTGKCDCNSGFTGDLCDIATCPGKPICGGIGTCPEEGMVCDCGGASYVNAECSPGPDPERLPSGYLLVTSGYSMAAVKSEVINVADPSQTCDPFPDFPIEQSFGNFGGVLDSDKIVVCPSRENGKCYKYDPSGSWIHFATLRISRQHAGTVIVPGEPDKLWILGGYGGGTEQQITTEFVFANGTVVDGPDLLEGNRGQCGFILENGDALVIGGERNEKKVMRYDWNTSQFTYQEDMNYGHQYASCTIFNSPKHGYRPVLYVGSGRKSDNNAELLDYTVTNTWEQIGPVTTPRWNEGPRAVTSADGIGVYDINNSEIHELSCDQSSCSWTQRPQELTTDFKRIQWFQAMYIPDKFATCA